MCRGRGEGVGTPVIGIQNTEHWHLFTETAQLWSLTWEVWTCSWSHGCRLLPPAPPACNNWSLTWGVCGPALGLMVVVCSPPLHQHTTTEVWPEGCGPAPGLMVDVCSPPLHQHTDHVQIPGSSWAPQRRRSWTYLNLTTLLRLRSRIRKDSYFFMASWYGSGGMDEERDPDLDPNPAPDRSTIKQKL
jgi:hypothetical protein